MFFHGHLGYITVGFMVDRSVVRGFINRLITGSKTPCRTWVAAMNMATKGLELEEIMAMNFMRVYNVLPLPSHNHQDDEAVEQNQKARESLRNTRRTSLEGALLAQKDMFFFYQSANHRVQQSAEYSFGSWDDGAGVPQNCQLMGKMMINDGMDMVPSALFSIILITI